MAVGLEHLAEAEPSSDFPTEDDCVPCRGRSRTACAVGVVLAVLAVGALGFLAARLLSRRRG